MTATAAPVLGEVDAKENYPALECPLCDKARRPHTLNKDGSASYRCPADHINHATTYCWRIASDGTFIE